MISCSASTCSFVLSSPNCSNPGYTVGQPPRLRPQLPPTSAPGLADATAAANGTPHVERRGEVLGGWTCVRNSSRSGKAGGSRKFSSVHSSVVLFCAANRRTRRTQRSSRGGDAAAAQPSRGAADSSGPVRVTHATGCAALRVDALYTLRGAYLQWRARQHQPPLALDLL